MAEVPHFFLTPPKSVAAILCAYQRQMPMVDLSVTHYVLTCVTTDERLLDELIKKDIVDLRILRKFTVPQLQELCGFEHFLTYKMVTLLPAYMDALAA